jgi:hypothetical protein
MSAHFNLLTHLSIDESSTKVHDLVLKSPFPGMDRVIHNGRLVSVGRYKKVDLFFLLVSQII